MKMIMNVAHRQLSVDHSFLIAVLFRVTHTHTHKCFLVHQQGHVKIKPRHTNQQWKLWIALDTCCCFFWTDRHGELHASLFNDANFFLPAHCSHFDFQGPDTSTKSRESVLAEARIFIAAYFSVWHLKSRVCASSNTEAAGCACFARCSHWLHGRSQCERLRSCICKRSVCVCV